MEKVLFVIGGSSDIGIAAIKEQIDDFDLVIVHYNHMNSGLETLQNQYEKILCFQADLSDESNTKILIEKVKELKVTPTHILHLPASKYSSKKFHKTKWEVFEKEINISLRSAVMILSAFLPDMSKNGYGRVIIMLSMVVNGMPPKHNADYVVVKYALLGLMKSLAVEYADKGITINGISPSLVKTKFIENMHDYIVEQNAQQSPTGKNLTIGDVIPTINFLMSDGAGCINGQNILVTCGR